MHCSIIWILCAASFRTLHRSLFIDSLRLGRSIVSRSVSWSVDSVICMILTRRPKLRTNESNEPPNRCTLPVGAINWANNEQIWLFRFLFSHSLTHFLWLSLSPPMYLRILPLAHLLVARRQFIFNYWTVVFSAEALLKTDSVHNQRIFLVHIRSEKGEKLPCKAMFDITHWPIEAIRSGGRAKVQRSTNETKAHKDFY